MDYANDLKRRIGMDTAHRVANNRKRAVRSFFDPNKKMAQAAFLKTLSGMRNYTYMFMRDAPKGKEWTGIKQFSTELAKKKNASPRNANHSFRLTTSGTISNATSYLYQGAPSSLDNNLNINDIVFDKKKTEDCPRVAYRAGRPG